MTFKNKTCLVTGGTGIVGRELSLMLHKQGAIVRVASMDENNLPSGIEHHKIDLRNMNNCKVMCSGMHYVFHVAGIKGSPVVSKSKQYTFFTNFIQLNTNMIAAMYESPTMEYGVYTSTVGSYGPAEIFKEDELWSQMPSKNDWYAGWAKRMGEVQINAYEEQYGIKKISVIRPVSIYGTHDNFNLETSTMVPSLIRKIAENDELVVWGDGSAERDIIHASDAARALLFVVQNKLPGPFNVGNGRGISIKEVVNTLVKVSGKNVNVVWDLTKPTGDKLRVADISRLASHGFKNEMSLEDGLRSVLDWYVNHRQENEGKRYEPFKEVV